MTSGAVPLGHRTTAQGIFVETSEYLLAAAGVKINSMAIRAKRTTELSAPALKVEAVVDFLIIILSLCVLLSNNSRYQVKVR